MLNEIGSINNSPSISLDVNKVETLHATSLPILVNLF